MNGEQIFEEAWDAFTSHLPGHHHTSAAPAAAAVTIGTTPGGPMSLSADLHAVEVRLEALGDEAVDKLEAVAANPVTSKVFTALHDLTGLNVDPSLIDIVASGLYELVQRAKAATPTPAGPQVAGQA